MCGIVLLVLCGRYVPAANPATVGHEGCRSDMDCQLNGICDTQQHVCKCDTGWKGGVCGDLDLFPGAVAYGCPPESVDPDPRSVHSCNVTSWGGGPPIFNPETKEWVLFVSLSLFPAFPLCS